MNSRRAFNVRCHQDLGWIGSTSCRAAGARALAMDAEDRARMGLANLVEPRRLFWRYLTPSARAYLLFNKSRTPGG